MYLLAPLSIVFIKYFPAIGRAHTTAGDYMVAGVTTGKNPLGVLCLVGSLIFIVDLAASYKERNYDKAQVAVEVCTLIMLFYLLALSNSMTSLLCLIIALSIIFSSFLKKHISKVLMAASLLYLSGITNALTAEVYETVGRNATLTGRTGIWETVLRMQPNPLIGTGYAAFWLGDRLEEIFRLFANGPRQAHNGYIEIYLNLGILGLFILILALHSAYKRITSQPCQSSHFRAFSIGFVTIFLIHNITEATFLTISPLWFIFLFLTVSSSSFSPDSSRTAMHC